MPDVVAELPFTHMLEGAKGGRSDLVVSHAPVALRSVPDDEAPASVKWVERTPRLVVEGRHFARVGDRGDPGSPLAWIGSGRVASDLEWLEANLPAIHSVNGATRSPLTLQAEAAARKRTPRATAPDRDRALSDAAAFWRSSLVLVGGVPHAVAAEPRHVVHSEHGRVVLRTEAAERPDQWQFRADHREQAQAFARRLATGRGVRLHDRSFVPEVIDASLLLFDEAVAAASFVACRADWLGVRNPDRPYAALLAEGAARDPYWAREILSCHALKDDLSMLPAVDAVACRDALDGWERVADLHADEAEAAAFAP